jgi:hypothetical protein
MTFGIDPTLLAALISAFVSLVVVIFNTNYLEPRRRETAEKTYREQLLHAWISQITVNLRTLADEQRHLELLLLDDRPLDRLALRHPDLVESMSDVRSRIVNLNRIVELYDTVTAPQIVSLLVPEVYEALESSMTPEARRELERSRRLKKWRDDWLLVVDKKREALRKDVEQLKTSLEEALVKEGIRSLMQQVSSASW